MYYSQKKVNLLLSGTGLGSSIPPSPLWKLDFRNVTQSTGGHTRVRDLVTLRNPPVVGHCARPNSRFDVVFFRYGGAGHSRLGW